MGLSRPVTHTCSGSHYHLPRPLPGSPGPTSQVNPLPGHFQRLTAEHSPDMLGTQSSLDRGPILLYHALSDNFPSTHAVSPDQGDVPADLCATMPWFDLLHPPENVPLFLCHEPAQAQRPGGNTASSEQPRSPRSGINELPLCLGRRPFSWFYFHTRLHRTLFS